MESIQDAINNMLNNEITPNNVTELASLIIVNEYLNKDDLMGIHTELDDVLPAYNKYLTAKRDYQLHKGSDREVLHCLKLLCTEIQEFIEELYSSTDMGKERREICHIIEGIHSKYCG